MSRIVCAAALAAIGMFSFAATAKAATPPASTAPPASTTTHAATKANEATMRPWRASETIGLRVENAQGQNLGKIEDLVFNPENGHIRYAVLSFGGVVGIGEKWFAIPWNHFRPETKTGTTGHESFMLVLDVDKNKLKNAPGFDSKRWPDFGDKAYGTSVEQFYGNNATAHRSTNTTK
jgi:sporulation protein YlmC with PRC-barrel domain